MLLDRKVTKIFSNFLTFGGKNVKKMHFCKKIGQFCVFLAKFYVISQIFCNFAAE